MTSRAPEWGPDEVAYVRAHYPYEGGKGTAAGLPGRTPGAVAQKAMDLGLARVLDWSDVKALDLDSVPEKWGTTTLGQGLKEVTKQILPKIQRRLGTLVEYDDVFDSGYLWMCRNPGYGTLSLRRRLLRLFSSGDKSGNAWAGGFVRQDLGTAWPPESAPREEVQLD